MIYEDEVVLVAVQKPSIQNPPPPVAPALSLNAFSAVLEQSRTVLNKIEMPKEVKQVPAHCDLLGDDELDFEPEVIAQVVQLRTELPELYPMLSNNEINEWVTEFGAFVQVAEWPKVQELLREKFAEKLRIMNSGVLPKNDQQEDDYDDLLG